jgi:hypothetical protein
MPVISRGTDMPHLGQHPLVPSVLLAPTGCSTMPLDTHFNEAGNGVSPDRCGAT